MLCTCEVERLRLSDRHLIFFVTKNKKLNESSLWVRGHRWYLGLGMLC